MIENSEVLFLWTETPLHAGSGSTVTAIDLPIQRDRQTGHPIIQSSGVKGVLRDHCKTQWNDKALTEAVFGPESDASAFGGAVSVSDARILLFPVRSLRGVCAWITCPLVLARLHRDLDRCELVPADFPKMPSALPGEGEAWISDKACPLALTRTGKTPYLVLEEYTLSATPNAYVPQIASWLEENALPGGDAYQFWHDLIDSNGSSHLVLLSDGDFKTFVESATDVAQRIKVDDNTGTVNHTGLWTEENLPADSLLWNVLHAAPPRAPVTPPPLQDDEDSTPSAHKVLACIANALGEHALLQIGGDETVGRGLTRVRRFGKPGAKPGGIENA
jgi:CRISPR-associated protein Cmr4